MLTVKLCHHRAPDARSATSMTIFECDQVEVLHFDDQRPTGLRMTWFAAFNPNAETNVEKMIVMDSEAQFGPAIAYIENATGKTVQCIKAEHPYISPNGLEGLASPNAA